MRILMINATYPFGSTGKIVKALEDYYNEIGYETFILYGQGEKSDNQHIRVSNDLLIKLQSLRTRLTGIMYGGCFISTNIIIKYIKKIRPDIVHLHCLNSNFVNIYRLIIWLKSNNIPTVLTNHAEFMYTANCGYSFDCNKFQSGCGSCPYLKTATKTWFFDSTKKSWNMMRNAFSGFNKLIVTNVSPWLTERASTSAILKNFDHYTVLNGVDTEIFYYQNNYNRKEFKTVLHVTSKFSDLKDDRKGGRYIIELAKNFERQNVTFLVAGNYTENMNLPKNIKLLGNIDNQENLAKLYSFADLVVITSKKETFSMITAESLCCGTPVVGFKAGAPELIAIPEYSNFVEYGDVESLYNVTEKWLSSSFDKAVISKIAKKKYSKNRMANDYIEVYNKCLKK